MSDQVSMVWVLRNKRTRKPLQWVAPFVQNEPTIYIWTDKHSALEFLNLLGRENRYEACFVPLDVVVVISKQIRVNPDMNPIYWTDPLASIIMLSTDRIGGCHVSQERLG